MILDAFETRSCPGPSGRRSLRRRDELAALSWRAGSGDARGAALLAAAVARAGRWRSAGSWHGAGAGSGAGWAALGARSETAPPDTDPAVRLRRRARSRSRSGAVRPPVPASRAGSPALVGLAADHRHRRAPCRATAGASAGGWSPGGWGCRCSSRSSCCGCPAGQALFRGLGDFVTAILALLLRRLASSSSASWASRTRASA